MSAPTQIGADLPSTVVSIGKLLETAISTQWVVLILIPILITLGSAILRIRAKKEREIAPFDKVIGFDLGVTACLTLMVSGFVLVRTPNITAESRQHYTIGLFIILVMFIGALSLLATVMHKFGWKEDESVKSKMYWIINGGGLFLLIVAFVLTGGTFP